jgi:hypothetical protein
MQENVLYDLIGRQDKGLATAYQVRVLKKNDSALMLRVNKCSARSAAACSSEKEFPCAVAKLGSSHICMAEGVSVCVADVVSVTQRYKESGDPVVLLESLKDRDGKSTKR